jgi:hypothetical protein
MKTAKEMYDYCHTYGFGSGIRALSHFQVIAKNLLNDEEALLCFIGNTEHDGDKKHFGNFAFALTNRRLIFAQKMLFGTDHVVN